ncbi:hypothetical protein, partial [Actinosynnema sp.]|uniref:hypothetical protein n=1 Tax=Actinosynnema sp. TaxID=1872144 RepID=UPI003F8604B7
AVDWSVDSGPLCLVMHFRFFFFYRICSDRDRRCMSGDRGAGGKRAVRGCPSSLEQEFLRFVAFCARKTLVRCPILR